MVFQKEKLKTKRKKSLKEAIKLFLNKLDKKY
jgi:hypothetical protein